MLEVHNLTAGYGPLTVLIGDLSLSLADGARLGIFGHNGAGKTTLLRCLSARMRPRGGTSRAGRRGSPARRPCRRTCGAASPSCRRATMCSRPCRRAEPAASPGCCSIRLSCTQVFDLFPVLAERRQQRAGSMCGGEQQMLALGMALMTQAEMAAARRAFDRACPVIVRNVMRRLRRDQRAHGHRADRGRAERPGDAEDGRAHHDPPIGPDRVPGGGGRSSAAIRICGNGSEREGTRRSCGARAQRRATRELVDWAAGVNARTFRTRSLWRAALVLADDDLAATVGGRSRTRSARPRRRSSPNARRCRSDRLQSRRRQRLTATRAAAANGMAATWCELDEGYRLAPCHAGRLHLAGAAGRSRGDRRRYRGNCCARSRSPTRSSARCAQAFPFATP